MHARGSGDVCLPQVVQVRAVDYAVGGQIHFAVSVRNAAIAKNRVEKVKVHAARVDMLCRAYGCEFRLFLVCDVAFIGAVGVVCPLIILVRFACNSAALTEIAVGITCDDRHFHAAFEGCVFSAAHIARHAFAAGAVVGREHDKRVVIKRA